MVNWNKFSNLAVTLLVIYVEANKTTGSILPNYSEIPAEDVRANSKFKIYWNVPSSQCNKELGGFLNLTKKYGIIQNTNDKFAGDRIVIMYKNGNFPSLQYSSNRKGYIYTNGGVPQNGNLDDHLNQFRLDLHQRIPNKKFNGIAIINFESWRPVFRQNWSTFKMYKDVSIGIERDKHPTWSAKDIEIEASKRFEESARNFMEKTMKLAKKERPLAKWGYYAFPFCFNMDGKKVPDCAKEVKDDNNRIQWLWNESDFLSPSLYLNNEVLNDEERMTLIKGRIAEAKRISYKTRNKPSILPYISHQYRNYQYVPKKELLKKLEYLKNAGASGAIIWGASNGLRSREKCFELKKYVQNILGPGAIQVLQGT